MVRHSESEMPRPRATRRVLSARRVVFGVLGIVAGIGVTVLNGGLNAIGREIIQKSQPIQREINYLQHKIEGFIPKQQRGATIGPEDLERLCIKQAMSAMPTEGFPGFIEKKGHCLGRIGGTHV